MTQSNSTDGRPTRIVLALPRALSLGNGNPRGLTPLQSCRQLCQFRSAIADHGPPTAAAPLGDWLQGRTRTGGDDLRREPLEVRKATLKSVLVKAGPGLRLNEDIEVDGPTVFAHACKMGLEGIVSKHKTSTYRSGRSPDWLKCKNPACEAVKREAEEDWGK
jgi:ATP dependent DNA ligase domain